MYTTKQKQKFLKIIKEELENISRDNEPKIKLESAILNEIFWDKNNGLNFTIEEMRKLDLSEISFAGKKVIGKDFSYTNVNIDPQTIYNKDLTRTNLEGVDMTGKSFKDVSIEYTNLKDTNATINPEEVMNKSLKGANLEGLDLSSSDFTDATVIFTNLKDTNAQINPQTIEGKNLIGTNLENLDMENQVFDGACVVYANLKGTNSTLTVTALRDFLNKGPLYETNTEGCTIITEQEILDEKIKSIRQTFKTYRKQHQR